MSIGSARRYRLLKWYAALASGDTALAGAWRSKHESTSGTALPAGFTSAAALATAGYTTIEDLTGASVAELQTNAGLNTRQAQGVLDALAAL